MWRRKNKAVLTAARRARYNFNSTTKVEAIIRTSKLDAVKNALHEIGLEDEVIRIRNAERGENAL